MNVVIKVNDEIKKKMIEYYKDKVRDKKIPYVVFQAQEEDTVITMYESGKVMFQGVSADVDAAMWGTALENTKEKQAELKKENNLTTNTLQIGQVLRIPTKEIYEGEENIYIVKAGDTLYKIAENNNTTVDEIKKLNNLTSSTLQIGQLLRLPSPLLPEETYTVKSGDSLYKIANKF